MTDMLYLLEQCVRNILESLHFLSRFYNAGQKLLRKTQKTASYLKPQAIENSFKRAYGEVEDNIIIYIERLKT